MPRALCSDEGGAIREVQAIAHFKVGIGGQRLRLRERWWGVYLDTRLRNRLRTLKIRGTDGFTPYNPILRGQIWLTLPQTGPDSLKLTNFTAHLPLQIDFFLPPPPPPP